MPNVLPPTAAVPNARAPRYRTPPWDEHHPRRLDLQAELAADHPARRIDQAVDRLDLSVLQEHYGRTGSLPYPPALLLKAILYELHQGRARPAQWWHSATESGPVRWLLRGARPARTRWYALRDRLGPELLVWHHQVLAQAVAQGLTSAERGALDGTLVAAQASRHHLATETKLQQRVALLEQAVAADEAADEAAVGPAPALPPAAPAPGPAVAPAATPVAAPGWLAPTPVGRRRQQRRYQQAQTQMSQRQSRNAKKRASKRTPRERVLVSPGDPEAILGRDKEGVFRPLYNVQLVRDLDSPLLLGYQVFAQANDAGTLGPLLQRLSELLGQRVRALLADAAYAGGADLAAAAAAGVLVYAPWQANDYSAAKAKPPRQLPKHEFAWLAEEQTYQCPQGHRLQSQGQQRQKRSGPETVVLTQYRCAPAHCQACPLQQRCTPNPAAGRTISRGEHEELLEALRTRMQTAEAKALYRLRGQTVELANADLKGHRQLRRFSGRGLTRAEIEVGLRVLVHNLLVLSKATSPEQPPGEAAASPDKIRA